MTVNDITSYLTTKASDGTDSIYTRTISGRNIKFNIDQVNGRIYSIDSLPSWTNLTRVVASFNYEGHLYAKWAVDSTYYPITSGKDSLDLSTPLDLLVVATDGVSSKHYTAVIYRYTANADSMLWTSVNHNLQLTTNQKLVAANDVLYVFAENGGAPSMSRSTDGTTWSVPIEFQTTATHLDCQSVSFFNNLFYALNTDGTIYVSTDGVTWDVASTQKVQRLLAADRFYLYAFDGTQILATSDLNSWKVNGTRYMNMLPDQFVSSATYNTRTNDNLQVDILAGISSQQTNHAVVWYKVAAKEQASNQQWDYITITTDNPYPLPIMNNLTIFHYNNALYAIGGDNKHFYKSEDNGITWKLVTEYQFPPAALIANKHVGITISGEYVWMIQTDAANLVKLWKGKINKLK